MGNMFYRRQQIDVIEKMTYSDLEYWNGWHEKMCDAEKKIIKAVKNA